MSGQAEPNKPIGRPDEKHECEYCLCCACERTCTRCRHCSPMNNRYIPLIGCPEFIDMRELKPLRYIYRADPLAEYKLHLKLP
ncbi:MAG: hypothetical protein EHM19_05165 [Candidatus Latescibacterota bacterium]|nr:MAG: hypothetical protein EHM19_05165 [Candidatus Latescibacterota bacterium]